MEMHRDLHAEASAEYLREEKSGGVGMDKDALGAMDASVGFSHPTEAIMLLREGAAGKV